jgi:predicted RNA-binding Zn-ribbon protein involved in translation (DUF1610 family)
MNALKSLKKIRLAVSALGVIGFALLVLYGATQIQILFKISLVVLAGAAVFWILTFRCPSCGDFIRWMYPIPEYCKSCGKRFEEMDANN